MGNTLWLDTSITQNKDNKYLQYFETNPFDVLNEIKNEIEVVKTVGISPTINEQINTNVLVDCLLQNADVDKELATAQQEIDIDQ